MVLVSVSIIPHGCMILDPTVEGLPSGSELLHLACVEAVHDVERALPNNFLVATPHGLSLTSDISVYGNVSVAGSAEWNGFWKSFCITCKSDPNNQKKILQCLTERSVSSDSIICFSNACSAPIAWGEVVPLWFHQHLLQNATVNILTFPQCRFDPLAHMNTAVPPP